MKVQIRNAKMEAVIVDDRGYAEIQAVVEALGGPLAAIMLAAGIPLSQQGGRLLVALRPLAERLNLPHQYQQDDDTFYIDSDLVPAIPPLPATPVGADVRPWHPVTAAIASGPMNRRPELLEAVLRQFRVAENPRYRRDQAGLDETYCNIYLWDCTRALGCEVPHWVDWQGRPVGAGNGRELDANSVVLWLRHQGPAYGWRGCSLADALDAANAGRPAVAVWENPNGIGHVAMLRPGAAHPTRGLPIAQSGLINADDIYLVDGFGRAADQVEYYTHD